MAAFVTGLREKKRERPFHYNVEQQNRGEQNSISNVRRKKWREREERQRERCGDIEESVALLYNAIKSSSFITSHHLHFIKLLSLISFSFYYLSAETVFCLHCG